MIRELYNRDNFYTTLWMTNECFYFDRCLHPKHLKPLDDFLLKRKKITPFSEELSVYQQARKCVLDFDIYTLEESYRKGNTGSVDLLLSCYRYAANCGITEAYNNIGVFFAMTDRTEEALAYWKKAALCGSSLGWLNLMNYYYFQENYEDVILCLDKLYELRHPRGCWNLALSYHFGMLGVLPDIHKAKAIYHEMMSLGPKDEKEKDEDDEGINELLYSKTWACYNLAKMRFMTEEHTKENLDSILHLLTRTPYVLLDQTLSNQLIKDITNCM